MKEILLQIANSTLNLDSKFYFENYYKAFVRIKVKNKIKVENNIVSF
jgi:hypothetical protein